MICNTLPSILLPLLEEFLMSSVYPPFGGPPAQLCLRCGTPRPSNVVTCVNGGTYTGTHGGQLFVSPSQYDQWGQPLALPQNTVYGTSYTPQSSSPPNNFY